MFEAYVRQQWHGEVNIDQREFNRELYANKFCAE